MKTRKDNDVASALTSILERERKVLLEGELEQLGELLVEKEKLLSEFALNPMSDDNKLRALREDFGRNLAMLESAKEGIQAVSLQLSEFLKVHQGLDVYRPSGAREQLGVRRSHTIEKRT
ncbi:hypothetical protein [Primorskyibacter sp. S87]|uniref:hypothetical protein n=1 Tax=Primorskyibacter sp. S87 TaxID=3415126 RepID=UPI003C7C9957